MTLPAFRYFSPIFLPQKFAASNQWARPSPASPHQRNAVKRGRRASNLTEQIKLILRIIIIRNCWLGSSCNTIESDKLLVASVVGAKRVCVCVKSGYRCKLAEAERGMEQ